MRTRVIPVLGRFPLLARRTALRAGVQLLIASSTACAEGNVDPSLEITRFERAPCPGTASRSPGDDCFRLTVMVNGSRSGGVGFCEVLGVDARGADISAEARMGDLKLDPGETYDEVLMVSKPKGFDHWEPQCQPTDGAS